MNEGLARLGRSAARFRVPCGPWVVVKSSTSWRAEVLGELSFMQRAAVSYFPIRNFNEDYKERIRLTAERSARSYAARYWFSKEPDAGIHIIQEYSAIGRPNRRKSGRALTIFLNLKAWKHDAINLNF
jgi:hypothetical protein